MSDCKDKINKLVEDLCPTKPVGSPITKFFIWIVGILLTLLGLFALHPVRPDLGAVMRNPVFLIEAFLLHSAFFLGSYHLFANAVPGLQKARYFPKIALLFLGLWLGILFFRGAMHPLDLLGACHNALPCIGQATLLNMVGAFLLIGLFRRHRVSVLGYVLPGLLLSSTFGTAVLEWTCQTMNPLHLLVAHGGPMLGMIGLLYGVFWWKKRSETELVP